MIISVVMTSYNGEKFVYEQLLSIKNQSKLPDEVLIFDDGSTDSTIEIIRKFVTENNLNWKLIKNKENLGWQKNFMQGIEKAKGELVFLADQDDIWHKNKVEIMSNIMLNKKEINVLTSKFKRVDKEFHIVKNDVNEDQNLELQKISKIDLTPKTSDNSYPGCTFCFRKSFFDLISPAWNEGYPHDALLYLAGWMSETLYCADYELHYFRRHESSASLKGPDLSIPSRLIRLERTKNAYLKLAEIFTDNKEFYFNENKILTGYQNWICLRIQMLSRKSIKGWFNILFKYKNYYPRLRTLFGDLYTIVTP